MYALITLVIEKVSKAAYGPGFCVLAALVIVVLVLAVAVTACECYGKYIEFEKWKIINGKGKDAKIHRPD